MVDQTLLRQLRSMTPTEWSAVASKMQAWYKISSGEEPVRARTASPVDYLLEGTHEELRRRGLLGVKARIASRFYPANFAHVSVAVRTQLEHCVGRPLSSAEQVQLGRVAARALSDYLSKGVAGISPKRMVENFDKIPVALDSAFPGYLESGVLPFCWRAR
jgi:hypothetical protein